MLGSLGTAGKSRLLFHYYFMCCGRRTGFTALASYLCCVAGLKFGLLMSEFYKQSWY